MTRHPRPESTSDDDRSLAERVSLGDPDAFDEMFRAFLSPLCRYIDRYVRSRDVAQDIAQGVFLQLWLRARERKLPPVQNVRTYLYNAARCDALDYLKRQRVATKSRYVQLPPTAEAYAEIEPADWDEELVAREQVAALQRAVDHLPPRQREVVLLRLKQVSYKDIAATLRLSVKTVDAHLQRAFTQLRSILKQLGSL